MRNGERGYTYLMLLFAIAAFGLLLAGVGESWQRLAQREQEADLLFIGRQYRQALTAYYESGALLTASPGANVAPKVFPAKLEELLDDRRFQPPKRHLRRLWMDPITHGEFARIEASGRIVGVYSRSTLAPLRKHGFSSQEDDEGFKTAASYADWRFIGAVGSIMPTPSPNNAAQPSGGAIVPPTPPSNSSSSLAR